MWRNNGSMRRAFPAKPNGIRSLITWPLYRRQMAYTWPLEVTPDCYTTERYLTDHPAVLGTYASLPASNHLDTVVMKSTFELGVEHLEMG